jgi:hypothetical protein
MERDQASKFVNDLLRLMVSALGSDLFLTCDFPPAIKVDGKVTKVSPQPLTGQHTLQLARSVMNDKQAAEFERTKECNFAISPQGVGRFRVNAFMQQGHVGMVFRTIPQRAAHHRQAWSALGAQGHRHDQARSGDPGGGHRFRQEQPRWLRWSTTATRPPTTTSSPSRTRWSSCTRTRTASSPSARSASTPWAGKRR